MKKLITFLLIIIALPVFAEDMPPLTIPATRSLGLGGYHVAYTDNVHALFVNPAALQRANQRSTFELSPSIVNLDLLLDTIEAIEPILDEDYSALEKLTGNGKIPIGIEVRGFPLAIGYTANGLGFGLWDRIHMDMNLIGTSAEATIMADVIANFGLSFNILTFGGSALDAGFVVKPFLRAMSHVDVEFLDAVGGADSFADDLLDDITVPLIGGVGFDLGFMYRFSKTFAAGLTIDDIATSGKALTYLSGKGSDVTYRVPTTLNLGFAYTLTLYDLLPILPGLFQSFYTAFLFDIHDLGGFLGNGDDFTKKNPALNLGVGLEVGLLNFLKLRVGLSEMLPSAGIGIETAKGFQLNVAAYGKELGNEPGQFSTWALEVSIATRPPSKPAKWPWSAPIVNSIIDSVTGGNSAGTQSGEAAAQNASSNALNNLDKAVAE